MRKMKHVSNQNKVHRLHKKGQQILSQSTDNMPNARVIRRPNLKATHWIFKLATMTELYIALIQGIYQQSKHPFVIYAMGRTKKIFMDT